MSSMTPRKHTRFQNEAELVKDTCEDIDVVLSAMNGREACGTFEERENREWLAKLIMTLAGITSTGAHDPDLAYVGRAAALRWLRGRGYVT
jgi:hypothetical protein